VLQTEVAQAEVAFVDAIRIK